MSFPMPQVIVTLPGRTVSELREQARRAARAGADAVEVRVDRLPGSELEALKDHLALELPSLLTVRSAAEGGGGPDAPEDRARLLEILGAGGSRWVDYELLRDESLVPRSPQSATGGLSAPVLSVHLSGAPDPRRLAELLRHAVPPRGFLKVVQEASVAELFGTVLPAFAGLSDSGVVLHTTAASGPLLRAWSRRLGMPAVFAAPASGGQTPVEPSQIPVDRLVPFLRAGPAGRAFAVLGHPVDGSMSPALHARWISGAGLPGLYVALDLASEPEFLAAIPELTAGGFCGFNVTRPWKEAALAASDRASRAAESARAANTLTLEPDGSITADNTDIAALLARLAELRAAGRWDGERLTVLGTGATCRSSLVAARTAAKQSRVWGRRRRAAEAVASEQGATAVDERRTDAPGLVVNTVPWAADAVVGAPAGPPELLERASYVVDWSYGLVRPPLGALCEGRGLGYEDGRRLLVYQAAESFAQWWETEPNRAEGLAAVGIT